MKYKHVLIITYGRSGSTLLQGLLNSIDGCLVRGENFNACYGIFCAFDAFKRAKEQFGGPESLLPTWPWYGVSLVDEERFLVDARALLINQLAPPEVVKNYQCIGFKEIRYLPVSGDELEVTDLRAYLDFLRRLLPECALIFLTRDRVQVTKSGWWKGINQEVVDQKLTAFEHELASYAKGKPEVFSIEYQDMAQKTQRLRSLFEFLGAPYDEEKVNKVLSIKHSYSLESNEPPVEIEPHQGMKQQGLIAHAFFDKFETRAKAGKPFVLRGVVVLKAEVSGVCRLIVKNSAGEEPIEWGLPSPEMAKKYPQNPYSQKARFKTSSICLADEQSVDVCLVDNENNHYCLATIGVAGNKGEHK